MAIEALNNGHFEAWNFAKDYMYSRYDIMSIDLTGMVFDRNTRRERSFEERMFSRSSIPIVLSSAVLSTWIDSYFNIHASNDILGCIPMLLLCAAGIGLQSAKDTWLPKRENYGKLDLRYTVLRNAVFSDANLRRALFRNNDMTGVTLHRTTLPRSARHQIASAKSPA
jgi:hypothetical protein